MANNEKSSGRVAQIASKILKDPKSTSAQKSVAGSVLTQAQDRRSSGGSGKRSK